MKKFLVVAVLAMLTGCASGQSPWVQAYGTNFPQANPGEAALILADLRLQRRPLFLGSGGKPGLGPLLLAVRRPQAQKGGDAQPQRQDQCGQGYGTDCDPPRRCLF